MGKSQDKKKEKQKPPIDKPKMPEMGKKK